MLLIRRYEAHAKLLPKVILRGPPVEALDLSFTRHLDVALLELDVFAHHDADLVGFHYLLGHRCQFEEDLLRLFPNLLFLLQYLLLQLVLLALELFLRLDLLFLDFFLYSQQLVLQFLNLTFVDFVGGFFGRQELLLLQLLL